MICCDLAEVEVKVSVVLFLCSCMTEFDPEVTLRRPIGWVWCRGRARGNGQRRLSRSTRGGGANLGRVVYRHGTGQVVRVVKEVNATVTLVKT